jgi:hypothetical protein
MNPDLLSQLRDIHTTPAVSWWPPAPGWWILSLLVLVLLAWVAKRGLARYRMHRRRQQMLAWVDALNANTDPVRDPQAYLATLNRIFKYVAVRAFPQHRCARMTGPCWVDFIAGNLENLSATTPLDALAYGPYEPAPAFEPEAVSELARQWIRQHG